VWKGFGKLLREHVAVRGKSGRKPMWLAETKSMWLAETKRETRTNVPLKNAAAELPHVFEPVMAGFRDDGDGVLDLFLKPEIGSRGKIER